MKGKIKKLVAEKGFGFIQGDGNKDIFFHHSCVADKHFDDLVEGQLVEYSIDEDGSAQKGPRAASVQPLESSAR
ncbi:MAG TPA: cold shock domain-containing protein [Pirellulales bacterium]|nr:cold shock domain-containing protein [Pirellulales bacterium]